MNVSNNIENLDLVVVINKSNESKKIFQFRPRTFFNQSSFNDLVLKDVDESLDGFILLDSDFVLTLEELNEGFNSDFSSLDEFFETMAEDEFLIIN